MYKMKIRNYDPVFLTTNHKQGEPCMPTDVFRKLGCGPSNSGKTNILLHMLYSVLHQNKYQALLQDFATKGNPSVGI